MHTNLNWPSLPTIISTIEKAKCSLIGAFLLVVVDVFKFTTHTNKVKFSGKLVCTKTNWGQSHICAQTLEHLTQYRIAIRLETPEKYDGTSVIFEIDGQRRFLVVIYNAIMMSYYNRIFKHAVSHIWFFKYSPGHAFEASQQKCKQNISGRKNEKKKKHFIIDMHSSFDKYLVTMKWPNCKFILLLILCSHFFLLQ